ncbi:MAG: hypothetical protein WBD09_01640 [Halobacteriota archaeon]
MSEEEIHKLRMEGMASMQDTPVKRKIEIIDILATYGEKGIPAIQDILNNAMSTTTANYATDVLKRLKKE